MTHLIIEDGTIEKGRPEYWKGAHAKGYNDAIGICLIGINNFTYSQLISLEKLLKDKGLKSDEVCGHYAVDKREYAPTSTLKHI